MVDGFLWYKAFHILSVIAWMAGLFYLPRLFVYHCRLGVGSAPYELFCTMERRLLKAIMWPSAFASWIFGFLTAWSGGYLTGMAPWLWAKLAFVVALTGFNVVLAQWQREFAVGQNRHDERFYRIMNEVPTLLLIGIVLLVVLRPFGAT